MAKTSYSGPENMHTLVTGLRCILCFQRITFLKTYLVKIRAKKREKKTFFGEAWVRIRAKIEKNAEFVGLWLE